MIKSLSIIFPVFNEELRLNSSFDHIKSFLRKRKNFKTEIIFVDDGSQDNSYKMIKNFILGQNKKNKIRVLRLKKNLGKGGALKLAVKKASYDWILTTDVDMSVSLFQIMEWLKKKFLNKKYFVYFGSRTHKRSIVKKNFFRNILGFIMRFLISLVLNINIKDTQCGFKLYKKKIAKIIFAKIKNNGFDHDLEIVLQLKLKKIKIVELPVRWIHKENSSLNVLLDPIKMFLGILRIRIRYF